MSAFTGVPRGAASHRRQHRILQVLTAVAAVAVVAALLSRSYHAAIVLAVITAVLVASWAHDHDYEDMDRRAEEWRAGY
jgi:Flp pilus assembly protein TadB